VWYLTFVVAVLALYGNPHRLWADGGALFTRYRHQKGQWLSPRARRCRPPGRGVAGCDRAFGCSGILVDNAGINPVYGPMIGLDLAAAHKIVDVSCLAALGWAQRAHRLWMAQHGGAIVNLSSVSGIRLAPGIGMSGASRAMLISMTELLAVEPGPDVRVNAVRAPSLGEETVVQPEGRAAGASS